MLLKAVSLPLLYTGSGGLVYKCLAIARGISGLESQLDRRFLSGCFVSLNISVLHDCHALPCVSSSLHVYIGTSLHQMDQRPPPSLVPTRAWSKHQIPGSKTCFYNKITWQSVWEKPKDFELFMPLRVHSGQPCGQGIGCVWD